MLQLLIGLVLFLGIHSLQSLAPQLRQNAIARWGALGFKGVYAGISLLGLTLLVQGYGQARLDPVVLWTPPRGMQHTTILLMWLAMVLLVAAYVPGNQIKAKLRHPMTLSVKVWALAHLLSNGNLADVLLFGGFLIWSVLVFRAARQRERLSMHTAPEGTLIGSLLAVALGTGVWAAFLMGGLHLWLIGVMPFTRAV
ncbi:NnrU family protein [Limnohabitans sp. Jir72]|uniref:NnrU family protein n=1 Tax=Limnohabitans sp. Jir72 TaxID=1977909 RepID=UPI000D37AD89|nr:NnrU family protein [Limnohabitans sp. Jir72]PUE33933.1 protein NrnU [Limnohabitans sp. Jir72]